MKSRIGAAIAMMTMLMAFGAGATTGTNNNDSCDISTAPAATLLLPYFEVDFNAPMTTAQTMLFTVANTSRTPRSPASRSGRTSAIRCSTSISTTSIGANP